MSTATLSATELEDVREYHRITSGVSCHCGEDPCLEARMLATIDRFRDALREIREITLTHKGTALLFAADIHNLTKRVLERTDD